MVSQVVEAKLVVCAICDIGCVRSSTLFRRAVILKEADRHAKELIDGPHPGSITLGQVIVDGNKVSSMTHDGVEVQGTGGHERLPFAGLHLRDIAKVERDTSKELFGEGLQPYETAGRFSYQCEGFRQQLGLGGACRSPLSELGSISLQTLIVEHDQRRLEFKDLWNHGLVCFEFASSWGKRAEQSHQRVTSTE